MEAGKLMGLDKSSSTGEGKKKKQEKQRKSLGTTHRQTEAQPAPKQPPLWGNKKNSNQQKTYCSTPDFIAEHDII